MSSTLPKNIAKDDGNGNLLGYHVIYECENNAQTRICDLNSRKNVTFLGYPQANINVVNVRAWTTYKVAIQVFNMAGASILSPWKRGSTKQAGQFDISIEFLDHVRTGK